MTYTIKVKLNNDNIILRADGTITLRELLIKNNVISFYPCGGRGTCGKCRALSLIDNKEILLCKTIPTSDMELEIKQNNSIVFDYFKKTDKELTLCLDVGTTTVELSTIDDLGERYALAKFLNPQSVYGADVLSRINSANTLGVDKIQKPLTNLINEFILDYKKKNGGLNLSKAIVCANTTLTHIFAHKSPESIGKYPYDTLFNGPLEFAGRDIGLNIDRVLLLPTFSAYFGSDALIGLANTDIFNANKSFLYVDLGTNGEIALVNGENIYLSSTAVGPCFEGVSISCGMGGVDGAITSVKLENDKLDLEVIGDYEPIGICGAGLISAISLLKDNHYIGNDGRFYKSDKIVLAKGVYINQKDINEFMLAKSAIKTAISVLMDKAHLLDEDIEKVYIAGNLGKYCQIYDIINTQILPYSFRDKCIKLGSNALKGVEEYCKDNSILEKMQKIKNKAIWVDLSLDEEFSSKYIKNLNF